VGIGIHLESKERDSENVPSKLVLGKKPTGGEKGGKIKLLNLGAREIRKL